MVSLQRGKRKQARIKNMQVSVPVSVPSTHTERERLTDTLKRRICVVTHKHTHTHTHTFIDGPAEEKYSELKCFEAKPNNPDQCSHCFKVL